MTTAIQNRDIINETKIANPVAKMKIGNMNFLKNVHFESSLSISIVGNGCGQAKLRILEKSNIGKSEFT
jgi:hypothetical protein